MTSTPRQARYVAVSRPMPRLPPLRMATSFFAVPTLSFSTNAPSNPQTRSSPGNAAGTREKSSCRPIFWKQRETNCGGSALFNRLVAAVLIEIGRGKSGSGGVHFDSGVAQVIGELHRKHVESVFRGAVGQVLDFRDFPVLIAVLLE